MAEVGRPPSGLFFGFAGRRNRAVLARLDDAARKLPYPFIGHEAVSPQHQYAIVLVLDGRDRNPVESYHVVFEPRYTTGRLDIHEVETNPAAVVDCPLSVDCPAHRLGPLLLGHVATVGRGQRPAGPRWARSSATRRRRTGTPVPVSRLCLTP
jgi:hypothetical protein